MTDQQAVGARSVAVQNSEDFRRLRRSFLSFIIPMTTLFLVWYLVYVLLAGFAPGLYATPVLGTINLGLILGLGQVVSTFAITMIYRSWADKRYDPHAEAIRREMETGEILEDGPAAPDGPAASDGAVGTEGAQR